MTALEYYSKRVGELNKELHRLKQKTASVYLFRLLFFLAFVAFIILFFSYDYAALYLIAAVLSLSAFCFVVSYDLRASRRKKLLSSKINFNEGEIKTLNHHFAFRATGSEYSALNPHLSADFDVFGGGSLYQYINRSVTCRGRDIFAAGLVACDTRKNVIAARSEAIAELSEHKEFIENFISHGSSLEEQSEQVPKLLAWLETENSSEPLINISRYCITLANIVLLILACLDLAPFRALILPCLVALGLWFVLFSKIGRTHESVGRGAKVISKYSELLFLIEKEQFTSPLLSELKSRLHSEGTAASSAINKLKGILKRFDYRYNIYVAVLLNAFTLFDFHTYCSLKKWKKNYGLAAENWFSALSEIDALMGYGVYAFNGSDKLSYAKTLNSDFKIEAEGMSHPLIAADERVSNDLSISGKPSVVIITGANMAGKSTFLRTLAINLLLGMNGAPVTAKSFSFTPVELLSSIKIQDSLANRESYFYAELLRLSTILESLESKPQSLIILDEILRGTNTKDKQQGSIGLLKKVIDKKAVALIATHDLVIGELENEYPEHVKNYCFEVEIEGDKLSFDYKLKRGISSKLNASFLMRKMHIID